MAMIGTSIHPRRWDGWLVELKTSTGCMAITIHCSLLTFGTEFGVMRMNKDSEPGAISDSLLVGFQLLFVGVRS